MRASSTMLRMCMYLALVCDPVTTGNMLYRDSCPIQLWSFFIELEGFTYATTLLNMGYCTKRLDPDASKICTIILPWGKYSFLWLPMGVACSPNIFQAKMYKLMVTLEFIQTYIDDLLCITKGSLDDHLAKLRRVLTRLQDTGLTVNVCKLFFCAAETEYLGYVLSRDGIKPQRKKAQATLTWTSPRMLSSSIGFWDHPVLWDIWARRREMLAPLAYLVCKWGRTKIIRANKTKKQHLHWDMCIKMHLTL